MSLTLYIKLSNKHLKSKSSQTFYVELIFDVLSIKQLNKPSMGSYFNPKSYAVRKRNIFYKVIVCDGITHVKTFIRWTRLRKYNIPGSRVVILK